ncbi:fibrobacter succinogenes major paralogous domain-containing protein [uncultured Fibrobacter sp.]|uniref:fibrobacter succinogenes major paralogous domain-containing protein n=1 Tax=uncultured Fibrobacter sp. TaxID=261512 RepID=UPI0028054E98|nr:fibrobacter succinogenes major paralogous domain-containing protein [uncultured Fibrobacter sp.]
MKKIIVSALILLVVENGFAAPKTGTMTDPRDGQSYRTVKIGNQVWMAENLNYKTTESFCYDNKSANCLKYGRLYTWDAAMRACPEGWHLPSDTEWKILVEAVGGKGVAGKKLKSTSGWDHDGNGMDKYGFSVLPAGGRYVNRYGDGLYSIAGEDANFWSSTEYDSYDAYYWDFLYDAERVRSLYNFKDVGFSVRCLRDLD